MGENTVELAYNFMKTAEIFVSLKTSVVITEEYNVMVNSEELIGTRISDAIYEVTYKAISLQSGSTVHIISITVHVGHTVTTRLLKV